MDQTLPRNALLNPSAEFVDVEHALRVAYGRENMDLCKINSYLRDLRGSTVSTGYALSPWDRMTGAAMLRAAVLDHLDDQDSKVIDAYYTYPKSAEIERRKLDQCKYCAELVHRAYPAPPFPYVADITLQWSGYGRRHADLWWRRQTGASLRMLALWRHGRHNAKVAGIIPILDTMLGAALDALEDVLFRTGAIQNYRGK